MTTWKAYARRIEREKLVVMPIMPMWLVRFEVIDCDVLFIMNELLYGYVSCCFMNWRILCARKTLLFHSSSHSLEFKSIISLLFLIYWSLGYDHWKAYVGRIERENLVVMPIMPMWLVKFELIDCDVVFSMNGFLYGYVSCW